MLRTLLWSLLALLAILLAGLALVVKLVLAPAAGEWAVRVALLGPLSFELSVPAAIRVASSPWFAPHLAGRRFSTAYGPVQLDWDEPARRLELRCAPCSVAVPVLGAQPLQMQQAVVQLRRNGEFLEGEVAVRPAATVQAGGVAGTAAEATPSLQGHWSGRLSAAGLPVQLDVAEAPLAAWYALLAPGIPELQRTQITGTLGLRAQFHLPQGSLTLQPRAAGWSVRGLEPEAALQARHSCGAPGRLAADSWLARAVVAAEDLRFFLHTGYEPARLAGVFEQAAKAQPERGKPSAATLTQRLAAPLVADGEQAPGQRVLRELLYVLEMEQALGKARILQLYLEQAPWGPVCGAEAAARHYFKRSAARLEPVQAVWLAALLRDPQAEAQRWASQGSPDPKHLQRIAEGIRGLPRRQRDALLAGLLSQR